MELALTTEQVSKAIKNWASRLKNRAPEPIEFQHIALEFLEDLQAEGIQAELFNEIYLLTRRRLKWFPTIADLLSLRSEAQGIIDRRRQAKNTPKNDEDDRHGVYNHKFGVMCAFNVKLMLGGKLGVLEAVELNTPIYQGKDVNVEAVKRRNLAFYKEKNINWQDVPDSVVGTLATKMGAEK